jgi:hypothetical protein
MSGRKQHYVPQALLRGFSKDNKRLWAFERDRQYSTSTDGLAAERDFYSGPEGKKGERLDDKITEYEAESLALLVQLRGAEPGEVSDVDAVSRLVSHLSIRNKSMRHLVETLTAALFAELPGKFRDVDWFAKETHFQTTRPNRRALETIRKALLDVQEYRELSPSQRRKKEEEGYYLIQDRLKGEFRSQLSVMSDFIAGGIAMTFAKASETHINILERGLEVEAQIPKLSRLRWTIMPCEAHPLILPDCAVVSVDRLGTPFSFALCERQQGVLLPLGTNRLVIGWNGALPSPTLVNDWLSSASDTRFFSESEEIGTAGTLQTNIGSSRTRTFDYLARLVRQQ